MISFNLFVPTEAFKGDDPIKDPVTIGGKTYIKVMKVLLNILKVSQGL